MRAIARTAAFNSDINVTPLVDVCLVLLIIFMVVVPSLVNGVPVALPESGSGTPPAERILPITLQDDGTVYIDTLVVRRDEVDAALQRLREIESSRPVGVRADKRGSYGEVVTILDACRKAGRHDVTLIAQRPSPTS